MLRVVKLASYYFCILTSHKHKKWCGWFLNSWGTFGIIVFWWVNFTERFSITSTLLLVWFIPQIHTLFRGAAKWYLLWTNVFWAVYKAFFTGKFNNTVTANLDAVCKQEKVVCLLGIKVACWSQHTNSCRRVFVWGRRPDVSSGSFPFRVRYLETNIWEFF